MARRGAATAAHLPHFDRDATIATYGLFHGQWLLDRDGQEARYPFGFGLSYTSASFEHARVAVERAAIIVAATLTNGGIGDATEFVQVYVGARNSGVERAAWRLAAFSRVDVAAGSSTSVELAVPVERLAIRSNGSWMVEPGEYEIAIGLRAHDPAARTMRVDLPAPQRSA